MLKNMFNFKKSWKSRYIKYYKKSKWPIIVDVASVFSVLALLVLFISLYLYNPEVLIRPNLIINKTEKEEPAYVLDTDNLPLSISFSFAEKYISQTDPQSTITMTLKNSSPLDIKDLKLSLESVDFLKIDKVELTSPSDNIKLISKNELEISNIEAELEDSIDLKITWLKPNQGAKASELKASLNYSIKGQELKSNFNLKTPKLETILKPRALVLYTASSGDKLGMGALPPIVDLPTNYWLFFELDDFIEASDFIMSAKLAKGVNLTGTKSLLAGDFSYDEETRMIFWKIKDNEASRNQSSPRMGLELQLIPDSSQVGSTATLVESINYLAKDAISGRDIKGRLKDINTDIPDDIFNKGQGTIQDED